MKSIFTCITAIMLCAGVVFGGFGGSKATRSRHKDIDCTALIFQFRAKPRPGQLPEMLDLFLSSKYWHEELQFDEKASEPWAYFFASASLARQDVLDGYNELFKEHSGNKRLFVVRVLRYAGSWQSKTRIENFLKENGDPKETAIIRQLLETGFPLRYDPVKAPIESSYDFEFLLYEYCADDRPACLVKMIKSLGSERSLEDTELSAGEVAKGYLVVMCAYDYRARLVCKMEMADLPGNIYKELQEIIDIVDSSASIREFVNNAPRESFVTPQRRWALGCSAILIEANHDSHRTLATRELTEANVHSVRKLLSESYGVVDSQSLLQTLQGLRNGRDSAEFDTFGARIASMSTIEYAQTLAAADDFGKRKLKIAKEYYKKFGEKSLLGWDLGRYITVCRWGYTAGYLTEDEAWAAIYPVAKELQETFISWEDIGRNYIVGRAFSLNDDRQDVIEDAFMRLQDLQTSPWQKYAWDMPLDTNEKNETDVALHSKQMDGK